MLYRVCIAANHLRDRGGATGKPANQRSAPASLRAKNKQERLEDGGRKDEQVDGGLRWKMQNGCVGSSCCCTFVNKILYENLGRPLPNI